MPESAVKEPIEAVKDERQSAPGQQPKKPVRHSIRFRSHRPSSTRWPNILVWIQPRVIFCATRCVSSISRFRFGWTTDRSRFSAAFASSITTRVGQERVASDSIHRRRLIQCVPCRCG